MRGLRLAPRDREGWEPAETPKVLAKTMRSPSEAHAKPKRKIRCRYQILTLSPPCKQA